MGKTQGIPLVMVHWQDITGHERPWLDPEEALEMQPAPMVSVGLLVHLNDDYLTIAGTWETGDEQQFGNVNCIPRGAVVNLTELLVKPGEPGGPGEFWSKIVSG
jgi:hypothetical protein